MKYPNDWHLLERDSVLHALAVDMYKGLTEKEVRQRRRAAGENTIWYVPALSLWDAVLTAVFDLAALLLIISAAAAALFDKSREAGALVVVLVIAAVLRTVTYLYAKRILEKCAREKIPTASVLRDGAICLLPASEIVPGDIIILEPGDTVPADGRVVAGEDSVVSERGITENKKTVHKFETVIETSEGSGEVPCEFRSNMLFAGSLVLSGTLRMAATACGEASLIVRKQGGIGIEAAEKLPLIEKLRIRSKTTSLVMLACVMLFTALSLFTNSHTGLSDIFLGTMAMAAASMSEFLTMIGTIMIAVSVQDAAETTGKGKRISRAVIRQPEKLEAIRNVKRVVFCGSTFFKSGRSELYAYRAEGEYAFFSAFDRTEAEDRALRELLQLAQAASAGTPNGMAYGSSPAAVPSDTESIIRRAVDSYVKKTGKTLSSSHVLYDHASSSETGAMGMEVSLIARGGDVYAVGIGSVPDVLQCCTHMETEDGTVALTDELRRTILTECASLAFSGASVAAAAIRKSPYLQLNRLPVLTQYMSFAGYVAVAQEPEKNAAKQIRNMKKAGIVPILFTQKPEADLYYCHRIGLFNKKTIRVHASMLKEELFDSLGTDGMIISFEDVGQTKLAAAYAEAMKFVMHNRVSDTDRILQDEEDAAPVTAALGRETWDSGVLAAADVGIATVRSDLRTVPETLSRSASVLVHRGAMKGVPAGFGGLDGMMRAMYAASRVFTGLQSAKSYLTASQCARLMVLLAAVLFGIPLLPAVFILIWGLLFDFAAVLMMAFVTPREQDLSADNAVSGKREVIASVIKGLLWGVLLAGLIPLLRLIGSANGIVLSAMQENAVLSGSILLSSAAAAWSGLYGCYDGKKLHIHTAGALYTAAVLLFAGVLMTAENALIGAAFCGWSALFAVIPALLLLFVSWIVRRIRRKDSGSLSDDN